MPSRRQFVAGLGATLGMVAAGVRAPGAFPTLRRGEWSTLNVSTQMSQFGLQNMTPNDPAVDAATILNEAIGLARSERFTTIIADPGTYYLQLTTSGSCPGQCLPSSPSCPPYYVVLNGIDGLTIDLQGSSLIAVGLTGRAEAQAPALQATCCTGLTLRNFTLDYDPLPFSQYTVTAPPDGSGTVTLATQTGFQSLSAFAKAPGDALVGLVFHNGVRLYSVSRFNVSNVTPMNGTVTLSAIFQDSRALRLVRTGDVLVIAWRGQVGPHAMAFAAPLGLTIENVSIYSSSVVGVYTSAASCCVFSRVNVVPAPATTRLVSTNADGLSLGQVGANNQIVDCTFDSVQDDSVSVNSLTLGAISNKVGPSSTSIVLTGGQGALTGVKTVLFVDPSTCIVYGPEVPVTPGEGATLKLNGPLPPGVEQNFLVFDADPMHRGSGLVVTGSRVLRSCFARGMSFWGLSSVTIQGNYFNGTHMAGIDILQKSAQDDWMCLPSTGITVQENVLENCNQGVTGPVPDPEMAGTILVNSLTASYGLAAEPVHTDITVQNNYVDSTPGAGLALQSIRTGSADGNLVQLTSPPVAIIPTGPGKNGQGFTLGSVTSDAAIQIAVAPVGGAVGSRVVPGTNASATLLTSMPPPAGPLTFVMVDSSGVSFTPTITGSWPSFQFGVPAAAAAGVAGLQISVSGAPVARGGMFIGSVNAPPPPCPTTSSRDAAATSWRF